MSDNETTGLKPTLGWFSAMAVVTGSMIGSGIFVVTPDIARHVGTGGLVILVWVLAGILTVLGASSYAKLAVHMPRAGGQYVFLKEAFGELPAFLFGWCLLTVIQTGFLAAVAVAFAKYAGVLWPAISEADMGLGLSTQKLLAVAVLIGLTAYNGTGIRNGALLQNIFTAMKIIALLGVIGLGFAMGHRLWEPGAVDWSFSLPAHDAMAGDWLTLVVFASVGALFSADAWNYVTFIGGEIKNPRRNLPIALIGGTVLVVTLYAVANLAYLNVLSLPAIQNAPQDRVATAMIDALLPGLGVMVMAVVILISTFGCLNGLLLAGARVFYAMAHDGLLFRAFGALHPRYHSPNFAMWAQCAWAIVLAFSGTYGTLLSYIVFATLMFYIVTMAGLLKLGAAMPEEMSMTRRRDRLLPMVYMLGATVIAVYLLLGDVFVHGWGALNPAQAQFTSSKFFTSMAGLVLTALGWPVYLAWKRWGKAHAL
ncbi:MAG: APC family permease [Candidatus Melainabacteria bacterium]